MCFCCGADPGYHLDKKQVEGEWKLLFCQKPLLKTGTTRPVEQDLHHCSLSRQDLIAAEVAQLAAAIDNTLSKNSEYNRCLFLFVLAKC